MKFKLIDTEKRKEVRCYYCGIDKSVKYEIEVSAEDMNHNNKRYCCNKCICMLNNDLEVKL